MIQQNCKRAKKTRKTEKTVARWYGEWLDKPKKSQEVAKNSGEDSPIGHSYGM